MEDNKSYLFIKDADKLQLSHDEYLSLKEKAEEAKRVQQVKNTVLADLQRILGDSTAAEPEPQVENHAVMEPQIQEHAEPTPPTENMPQQEPESSEADAPNESSAPEAPEAEKVSVEFAAETSESPDQQPDANGRADTSEVPSIKNEIIGHFNKFDDSGRLFNVFKQYYTCLNEACGGTVRVTMKDGFCSLWNYDEWEEFAFVDIFEGLLRISIDPRYTDALKSLSLCEAPRLIASRRNVICVQIDDLNNTVLDVLTRAFSEVGMQVG